MDAANEQSLSTLEEGDPRHLEPGNLRRKEVIPVLPDANLSSGRSFSVDLEASINLPGDNILMLTENDVPGSSLNGRDPGDLSLVHLRRWLACRGAPVSGRKPQLIERVQLYIQFGWDKYLVDPDNGVNCHRKLASTRGSSAISIRLMQSVPAPEDVQWTSRLYNLPGITFGTIYDHLVDRKVVLEKVSCLENIADQRADAVLRQDNESTESISIDYTRTLEKAYRFFQDGHVQNIKYHPLPEVPNHSCVSASVLPSMKKDRVYKVMIFLCESTVRVAQACCSCPAGLSGCCNHITGTLYCLEDYIHSGLQDDERKGCTERLQTWNHPRKRNIEPKPIDEVHLVKKEYGVKKRMKTYRINEWDCRPEHKRIVDPNKSRNLRKELCSIEQKKIDLSNDALCMAKTPAQKKKAALNKSLLERYSSSCYLQLLDDEPAPSDSHLDEIKKERVIRAAEQKKKLLNELAARQEQVHHDHTYASLSREVEEAEFPSTKSPRGQLYSSIQLYNNDVVINASQAKVLEEKTREQSSSDLWHNQRKLRITASVMKEVCHRRVSTSCTAFVKRKISNVPLNTVAVRYGREHEKDAINSYVDYQINRGVAITVQKCGLVVDASLPWLAASPDGIVTDPTLQQENSQGCLEVKCPFSCENMSISKACRTVPAFCLVMSKDGSMCLSESHAYYYQLQTQMHVTHLQWCDFVVWSSCDIFVQRIKYDPSFMKSAISTAGKFYFQQFLPAVVPYVIMPPVDLPSPNFSVPQVSGAAWTSDSVSSQTASVSGKIPVNISKIPVSFAAKIPVCVASKIPVCVASKMPVSAAAHGQSVSIAAKMPGSVASKTPISAASQAPVSVDTFSVTGSHTQTSSTFLSKKLSLSTPLSPGCMEASTFTPCGDVQIVAANKISLQSLDSVLQCLNSVKHVVKGDGSCLYHAISHQAGFIPSSSQGDVKISTQLRSLASRMMCEHPDVRAESNMSSLQWSKKRQDILNHESWGSDLDVRLMAIGLQRDIIVVTALLDGSTYARRYLSQPPPLPKMKGGVFIPLTTEVLCSQWKLWKPSPLLIIYNGHNHYDSTIAVLY